MRLRRLEEKDIEGMLEWMYDTEIQKSFRFSVEKKRKEDVLNFIREAETEPIEGKSIHLAIVDESDEYLGTVSLKNIDLESLNAEFAISLRRNAQGKGVGSEATKELLYLAFNKFGLERIYLNVLSENKKAIHLYEKCGFVYEGEFRKHLFLRGGYRSLKWYSILREDFETWGVLNRNYTIKPSISLLVLLKRTNQGDGMR